MSSSLARKRRWPGQSDQPDDEESTEVKLVLLTSLFPEKKSEVLFDYLLAYDGSVEDAASAIKGESITSPPRKKSAIHVGHQSSLSSFINNPSIKRSAGPAKGRTLHVYSPEDVERLTPCTLIHNFLPKQDADLLLRELLDEVPNYRRSTFQMFERTVESPHTFAFYVNTPQEVKDQRDAYVYNGAQVAHVHQSTPEMLRISMMVRKTVNEQIARRIQESATKEKLKFQSPAEWKPNTTFVNCYDGPAESVGFHSDQLTYLGPNSTIGSLSLGVEREFRVRKVVDPTEALAADTQGQIAIHLPSNSLLIMHASCQEEWKHSIAPVQRIVPHPVAGNKRINITYRCYQDYLHPRYTPRCACNVACVLRCVQKRTNSRGRYMWQCYSHSAPGQKTCGYFAWAEFDIDGKPPWAEDYKGNANIPTTKEEYEQHLPPNKDDEERTPT